MEVAVRWPTSAELRDMLRELQEALGEVCQQEEELRAQLRRAIRHEGRNDSRSGWQRVSRVKPGVKPLKLCRPRRDRRTTGRSNRDVDSYGVAASAIVIS